MVKRTLLLGAALAVVGQSLLMAGPAIAKTKTRACPSVTVGRYEATDVRVTPNLGCAAAEGDLRIWLKQPSKLPRSSKGWHSKQVRGTWEMAYGHYPVSLFFVLVKLQPPTPTPTPTSTPAPTSTTTSTPTSYYSDAEPDSNSDTQADSEDLLHLDSASSSHRERVSLHGCRQREFGLAGDADA